MGFASSSTLRNSPRLRVPFAAIKNHILGEQYDLSFVTIGDDLARSLNRAYRSKSYAANVLSFPLATDAGELFINVRVAQREARTRGISPQTHIAHLFVHGCLHLKGHQHGAQMEARERRVLRAFGFEPPQ